MASCQLYVIAWLNVQQQRTPSATVAVTLTPLMPLCHWQLDFPESSKQYLLKAKTIVIQITS